MAAEAWVYLVPVHNFGFGDGVPRSLRIGPVSFVHSEALDGMREQFGIPKTLSEYAINGDSVLPAADTLAVVVQDGAEEAVADLARAKVNRAIEILACSMYGWARRWDRTQFGVTAGAFSGISEEVSIGTAEQGWRRRASHLGSLGSVVVDSSWVNCGDAHGSFFPLLRILNDERPVTPPFRDLLSTAAAFAGRSWMAFPSLADSLLFGWISLELLLRSQGESTRRCVPLRAETVLGVRCLGTARRGSVIDELNRVYGLRNDLVHGADDSRIVPEDVLFLDDVLHNVLGSIARLAPAFGNDKPTFLASMDRERARLGPGPSVEPHGRVVACPQYNDRDLQRPWVRVV